MKNYKLLLLAFLFSPLFIFSQEQGKDSIADKPERPAFESSFIIDNPTNVLFTKNTLEIQMSHRFGEINGGDDLAGIYGIGNIRIGLSYAIHDRLTIGFGTTKDYKYQDFNWKVGILSQTRSDKIPVSISYYGNFALDARRGRTDIHADQDRYSYFNQLIIARRFTPKFSMQIAPSLSHYNIVTERMRNDKVAIAVGGRYKISEQTAILLDYSHPFTHHLQDDLLGAKARGFDPDPGFSIGAEFSTSGHAFQLFITNYKGILPQENYMYNQNNFLIGFNITRLYNF